MSWLHRTYNVVHGRDGFALQICDEWWPAVVADHGVDWLLTALGHPCCADGPLSRLTVRYRTLRRFGLSFGMPAEDDDWDIDLDENALDLLWLRFINLPGGLHTRDRWVARLPLTDEEALTIRPEVAGWSSVWESDDASEE